MDTSGITTFEASYEAQCDNYKKQIHLLQEKISYYERDYHQNNLKLQSRLKEIEERDYYLQKEINQRDSQLDKLSDMLQEKTTKVASLESAIAQLNSQSSQEKNKLFSSLETEREAISTANDSLKEEIASLQVTIAKLRDENERKTNQLEKVKEENGLFNSDNTVLLKKLQEYEDNYSTLIDDKAVIDTNYKQKLDQCAAYEKRLAQCEREIDDYTSHFTNEIKTIIQWVETYFGFCYPSTYEIPSLSANSGISSNANAFSANSIISSTMEQLKKSLETARLKTNKEQNALESYAKKQKGEISDLIQVRDKKQNDINSLRTIVQELTEQNHLLQVDNENYLNEIAESKQMLSQFQQSIESIGKENNSYLNAMYSTIKNELDAAMKDETLVHYTQIILKNASNRMSTRDLNTAQYLLEDVLDRLLHFVSLLRDDYRDVKKENLRLLGEAINKKGVCYQEVNELNAQVSALKSELSKLEVVLSRNGDENMLLMSQINMLENTLQGKEETIAQLKKEVQFNEKRISFR